MKRFGVGILAGFGGTFGGLLAGFLALYLFFPGRLPAPAISPIIQIDEKLKFIRDNPQIDPTIIAVGSSIAFRQLAGDEFRNFAGGRRHFLNGGVVQVQVDETEDLAEFYLDNYPRVETVLMVTGPPDFQDCSSTREPMLDPESARGFSFDRYPSVFYYLRYFSPQRYLRGVMNDKQRRTPFYGDIYIDEFGSGPVKIPRGASYGLRYGEIRVDPVCIDAMNEFAENMARRGVQFVVVFAPINPKYREVFRASVTNFDGTVAEIRKRIGHEAYVLDLHKNPRFASNDFYDAFHLQWSGARVLSDIIVTDLEHLLTDNALVDVRPVAETAAQHPTKQHTDSR